MPVACEAGDLVEAGRGYTLVTMPPATVPPYNPTDLHCRMLKACTAAFAACVIVWRMSHIVTTKLSDNDAEQGEHVCRSPGRHGAGGGTLS